MTTVRRDVLVLGAVFAAGLALAAVAGRAEPPSGPSPSIAGRALLIGINDYPHVRRLRGAVNDIETMRQVLLTRYGFSPDHIQVLRDQQATRAAILAALERLAQEAGPDDRVVIHFAGHGSQVQDQNGDEADGWDETILPYDGRAEGIPDITDDELERILSRLKAKQALIVLDSCHSGTATRSLEITTRSVPRDQRLGLYAEGPGRTRGLVPLFAERYILMTGAAENQNALDAPIEGRYHGVFSYALTRSLGSAPTNASPREVFAGAERELRRIQTQLGLSSMPEPQLEAPADRLAAPLLVAAREPGLAASAPQPARLPWAEVRPVGPHRALLVNGLALGAMPDSAWGIYPPGETDFPPDRARAVAHVIEVQGTDALARIEPAGVPLPTGSRAVALSSAASVRVPVRVVGLASDRQARLEASLRQRVGEVALVGPGEFARYVIEVQGEAVRVLGADGVQPVASFLAAGEADLADRLAALLIRSQSATELVALENQSSRIQLSVRVVSQPVRGPQPVGQRGLIVVAEEEPARFHIRHGSEPRTGANSLQLEVRATCDCYLTVVDVDSEGGVNLLFPNEHQSASFHPSGKISAGETVLLPDSLQSGNRAGFHWDYSRPPGLDTIRVFASTDLDTANLIRAQVKDRQPIMSARTRGGLPGSGAVTGGLEGLRKKLTQVATRGLIVVPDQPEASSGSPVASGQGSSGHGTPLPAPSGAVVSGSITASPPGVAGSGSAGSDWTAATMTVLVAE